MKRVLAAAIGGILVPAVYFAGGLVVFATVADGNTAVDWNGVEVLHPAFAPIGLPIYLFAIFEFNEFFGLRAIFANLWFRLTFFFLFNYLLYAFLSHWLLQRLGWPKM